MKYTVFSVDDSRKHYTKQIHNKLKGSMERVETECVDARIPEQFERAREKYPYKIAYERGMPRLGHIGIWSTVLNSFEHAPHVTFEDDAILGRFFTLNLNIRLKELPEDADFFSLFLPRDSDHLWNESLSVSDHLTKTYQRYGGVSMYYTEQGVDKIKSLLDRDGITGQYDDTLYAYAKSGELNGYCSKPTLPDLVSISGTEDSIVQESDFCE